MVLSDLSFKRDGIMLGVTISFAFYMFYKQVFDWFGIVLVFGLLRRYFIGYMNACNKITILENQLKFSFWYKKQLDFSVSIPDIKNMSVHYGVSTWQERLLGGNKNLLLFEANNLKYQVVFSRGPKKLKVLTDFLTKNGISVQTAEVSG
jgi:hypothetical protein